MIALFAFSLMLAAAAAAIVFADTDTIAESSDDYSPLDYKPHPSPDAFPSHRFSLNGVAITPDNQHFAGHTYRGESIEKMAANDAGNGVANAVSKLQNIRPEYMRISV